MHVPTSVLTCGKKNPLLYFCYPNTKTELIYDCANHRKSLLTAINELFLTHNNKTNLDTHKSPIFYEFRYAYMIKDVYWRIEVQIGFWLSGLI